MRNKFYKVKLKDILSVKRGTSLSGQYYATSGDKIRLTLGNFNYPNGGFKTNTSKDNIYFSAPVKSEYILKKGDIITPLTEQVAGLLGETAKIPEDDLYIQSGDIALIIPKEDKLYKDFAYYLISSKMIKYQLGAAAQQTKIRHTSPEKIENCEAWMPQDIETQRDISHLLDTINDKIALNNKINKELEQMAKTLYEYWFVQFDFPDEKGRPYKSANGKMVYNDILKREIPEGWEVGAISDVCEIKSGHAFSSNDYSNDGIYKLITIKNVLDGYISTDTDNFISVIPSRMPKYCLLKELDILLSLTGNVGRVGMVHTSNLLLNQRVGLIVPRKEQNHSYLYLMFSQNHFKQNLEKISTGSNQKNLSPIETEMLNIPIIPDNIMFAFNMQVQPLLRKIIKNTKENQKLSELRDFLLPLLMNGQVSVQN